MVTRSPEGGDKPSNPGLSDFKALPKRREVGWSIRKPEEPKQQPSDPAREGNEQHTRRSRCPIVAGGEAHIRNQRLLLKLDNEGDDKR
jgi:hypothetical protein